MKEVKDKVIGMIVILLINSITVFMNSDKIIKFIIGFIPEGINIIAMNPTDVLSLSIGMSFLISFIILIPLIIYYSLDYLKDALYEDERKTIYKILTLGTILFIFGFILSFISFVNYGLDWFASFNVSYGVDTLWSLKETLGTILIMTFLAGIIFEFPIVLYFLIKKNVFSFKLNNQKRLALLFFITLSLGILTPDGSMFTQVILTAPIWLLLEISVYLGNRYKEVRK